MLDTINLVTTNTMKYVYLASAHQHLVNVNHHQSNCYCNKTLIDQISNWCKLDQRQLTLFEIWLLVFSAFALQVSVTHTDQFPRSQA